MRHLFPTITALILSWTAAADAKAYHVECDGMFVAIVDGTDSTFDIVGQPSGTYTVRAANMHGGFGPAMEAGDAIGIDTIVTDPASDGAAYDVYGRSVGPGYKGIVIKNGNKYISK